MNLSLAYAAVIRDIPKEDSSAYVQRLIALMRHRGHLSLLPEIVRILEKQTAESDATVIVAHDRSLKEFASEIKSALAELGAGKKHQTVVDPRAVGGYSVRANSKIIDNTYRTALVSLYQKTISS